MSVSLFRFLIEEYQRRENLDPEQPLSPRSLLKFINEWLERYLLEPYQDPGLVRVRLEPDSNLTLVRLDSGQRELFAFPLREPCDYSAMSRFDTATEELPGLPLPVGDWSLGRMRREALIRELTSPLDPTVIPESELPALRAARAAALAALQSGGSSSAGSQSEAAST